MFLLKEKRVEKRLPVNLPVTYSYDVDNSVIAGKSSTTNLSDSGLSFYSDMPLKEGHHLRVHLNHIWDAPRDGIVRWCAKQHTQYKIGISF